jgi:hypothetical protein
MNIRKNLPPIDLGNDWLNKDRELYTLIFTKTGLAVALNGVNIALGSDSISNAAGRSAGNVVSGLIEMAGVSLNRLLVDAAKKSKDGGLAIVFADVTAGPIYAVTDVGLNVRLTHLPVPYEGFPIAQIDNLIVNPLHGAMVRTFLPPSQVIALPNIQTPQKIVNGLSILTNVVGSVAVVLGMIATQVIKE